MAVYFNSIENFTTINTYLYLCIATGFFTFNKAVSNTRCSYYTQISEAFHSKEQNNKGFLRGEMGF